MIPLLALSLTLGQPTPPSTAEIDKVIQEAMDQWKVPGAAIVIVHRGRIAYLKGFGVRDIDSKEPVTPDTVFPLASCTKPFTTLAMAMAVEDGKLRWDDPVRKHLPWFKLADPLADANVTIADLLTHRTGLGRHDWLWYQSPDSLEQRVRQLAYLEPTHSFRTTFEYQTIAFGAAGLALENAVRTPWADYLRRRLFTPLGLKATSAVFPEDCTDLAHPHRHGRQRIERIERYRLTEPDPAGSVHSSARDLAAFLQLQLQNGSWHGRPLVAAESVVEIHRPHMLIRLDGFAAAANPETRWLSYGLGWVVQDYRGKWLSMHGGAIDGFRAHFTLVPEAQLGIALLNNLDKSMMNLALSNQLVDRFCGLPERDWNRHFRELKAEDDRMEKARIERVLAKRQQGTAPSLPLDAYAGEYVDPAYGMSTIRVDNGKLIWRWRSFEVPLEHFHFDTFVAKQEPALYVSLGFQLDELGRAESLRVLDRTFKRRAPER